MILLLNANVILIVVISAISLGLGVLIAGTVLRKSVLRKSNQILKEATSEAEVLKKEKILQAKEKFLQLKAEHEKYVAEKNHQLSQAENKLKQKESSFSQKMEELSRKQNEVSAIRENLNNQLEILNNKQADLDKTYKRQLEELESISGMSAQEAKLQLVETLKQEAQSDAQSYIREVMEEAKLTSNMESKKLVIQSLQRTATEVAIENSVSVFPIESDEIKGRVIGREGRNIRAGSCHRCGDHCG